MAPSLDAVIQAAIQLGEQLPDTWKRTFRSLAPPDDGWMTVQQYEEERNAIRRLFFTVREAMDGAAARPRRIRPNAGPRPPTCPVFSPSSTTPVGWRRRFSAIGRLSPTPCRRRTCPRPCPLTRRLLKSWAYRWSRCGRKSRSIRGVTMEEGPSRELPHRRGPGGAAAHPILGANGFRLGGSGTPSPGAPAYVAHLCTSASPIPLRRARHDLPVQAH